MTVPTVIPVLILAALVCAPVWFASCWVRDRLLERVKRHYDRKLAELRADGTEDGSP